jgi:hypothetical protein
MKPKGLSFYLQTILLATALNWLLSLSGFKPSSQLTILLVLFSVGLLRLFSYVRQRLKFKLRQRQNLPAKQMLVKEKEMGHENDNS